jgi:hypothetical protein
MKNVFKTAVVILLAALTVTAVAYTIAETNKLTEIKKQNGLIERHIVEVKAQNELLREEKMCIAFEQNRPDRQAAPPMQ